MKPILIGLLLGSLIGLMSGGYLLIDNWIINNIPKFKTGACIRENKEWPILKIVAVNKDSYSIILGRCTNTCEFPIELQFKYQKFYHEVECPHE